MRLPCRFCVLESMAYMLAKPGPSGKKPIPPTFLNFLKPSTFSTGSSTDGVKIPHNNQQLRSLVCDSILEHNASLDVNSKPGPCRLTHIVCTIGPASREVDVLLQLMQAGMNICRLNFSHGTYEYHQGTMRNIKAAAARLPAGTVVATALDTKGPEIRTGLLEGGPSADVNLLTGRTITITTRPEYKEKCSEDFLWVDYKNISKILKEGSIIYIDDGLISLQVIRKDNDSLLCQILNGGILGSHKGCNLPNTPVDLPAVSERDKKDLIFGMEQNVDMIFASFIQNAAGIREIRKILGDKGKHIKIIAKIESYEGIYNFMDILEECDGAMVARGDMGIEIPPEKVFIAQKLMISACNKAGKPVICATQMLESMTYKPRATRSESNDVANAVLDGADCVMLSGESAKGLYPLEAVKHMSAVCLEAESVFFSLRYFKEMREFTPVNVDSVHAIAMSAVEASYQSNAGAILALTESGRTAHLLSSYKPRCPIIVVTKNITVAKQALLNRAVVPFVYSGHANETFEDDINSRITAGLEFGTSRGIVQYNDTVILVMAQKNGPNQTNCIHIITCKQCPKP